MAYENPLYLEDLSYNAKQLRQLVTASFAGAGVLNSPQLAPSPASSGLVVNFTAGYVVVEGTASAGQGMYLCPLSDTQAVTVPAAPGAGLSRIDLLVAQVADDDEDGGGESQWSIVVVEGTAADSDPAAPAVPASSLALCTVSTTGTQTDLTAANIGDLRVRALGWNEDPGEIKMWPHVPSPPMGWAFCDGSAVSRTANPNLFDQLGTLWGAGDGTTTFNLPDFRGRAPIGMGTAGNAGTSARTLAQKVGEEQHLLGSTEMPAHNHSGVTTIESAAHNHHPTTNGAIIKDNASTVGLSTDGAAGSGGIGATWDSANSTVTSGELQSHTHGIPNAGGAAPHNNMQPSLVIGFIIRLG